MTHYGRCAILFKKDTLHQDIKASFVNFYGTEMVNSRTLEKGGISRALFGRLPRNGKSFFTSMSLHINNQFAKKRGIGKKLLLAIRAVMLKEHVDLVASFNSAAWRRTCGNHRKLISILEEAFADTDLPMPPCPTPLW